MSDISYEDFARLLEGMVERLCVKLASLERLVQDHNGYQADIAEALETITRHMPTRD